MNENAETRSDQTAETQPEVNGDQNQSGRMFTQEEVNHIIKERLERERAKAAEPSPEMRQRLADLEARENKLACREYLEENGMVPELMELFDTSNAEEFKGKVDKLMRLMNASQPATPLYVPDAPPLGSSMGKFYGDPAAMGFADSKHVPQEIAKFIGSYRW